MNVDPVSLVCMSVMCGMYLTVHFRTWNCVRLATRSLVTNMPWGSTARQVGRRPSPASRRATLFAVVLRRWHTLLHVRSARLVHVSRSAGRWWTCCVTREAARRVRVAPSVSSWWRCASPMHDPARQTRPRAMYRSAQSCADTCSDGWHFSDTSSIRWTTVDVRWRPAATSSYMLTTTLRPNPVTVPTAITLLVKRDHCTPSPELFRQLARILQL